MCLHEGVVEAGEDAGNCAGGQYSSLNTQQFDVRTAKNELALADGGAQGDVLLSGTGDLLRGHLGCW
jgi:hypothetical protein